MKNLKLNPVATDQQNAIVWVPTGWDQEFDFFGQSNRYFILEITIKDKQGREDKFTEVAFYPKNLGDKVMDEIYCRKIHGQEITNVRSVGGGSFIIDEESGKIILRKADKSRFGLACRSDLVREFPFATNSSGLPAVEITGSHCVSCGEVNTGVVVPETFLLK